MGKTIHLSTMCSKTKIANSQMAQELSSFYLDLSYSLNITLYNIGHYNFCLYLLINFSWTLIDYRNWIFRYPNKLTNDIQSSSISLWEQLIICCRNHFLHVIIQQIIIRFEWECIFGIRTNVHKQRAINMTYVMFKLNLEFFKSLLLFTFLHMHHK